MPAYDPEDGAALAMSAPARGASAARAAHRIDLTHDPSAAEERAPSFDHTDKLVSRDPRERVVAPGELDVGVADPGLQDPDEGLTRRRVGPRYVVPQVQLAVFEPQGAHGPINMEER